MEAVLRLEREVKIMLFLMKKCDKILSSFLLNLGWEC